VQPGVASAEGVQLVVRSFLHEPSAIAAREEAVANAARPGLTGSQRVQGEDALLRERQPATVHGARDDAYPRAHEGDHGAG
jgi:hypothetical protein